MQEYKRGRTRVIVLDKEDMADSVLVHSIIEQVMIGIELCPPVFGSTEKVWLFIATANESRMLIQDLEECSSCAFLRSYDHEVNFHC